MAMTALYYGGPLDGDAQPTERRKQTVLYHNLGNTHRYELKAQGGGVLHYVHLGGYADPTETQKERYV